MLTVDKVNSMSTVIHFQDALKRYSQSLSFFHTYGPRIAGVDVSNAERGERGFVSSWWRRPSIRFRAYGPKTVNTHRVTCADAHVYISIMHPLSPIIDACWHGNVSNMNTPTNRSTRQNGEVIIGDLEYDGRVILYIIKGFFPLFHFHHFVSRLSRVWFCLLQPTRPHTLIISNLWFSPPSSTSHTFSLSSTPVPSGSTPSIRSAWCRRWKIAIQRPAKTLLSLRAPRACSISRIGSTKTADGQDARRTRREAFTLGQRIRLQASGTYSVVFPNRGEKGGGEGMKVIGLTYGAGGTGRRQSIGSISSVAIPHVPTRLSCPGR